MNDQLWAFLGISVLVIVTPGPDTALTVRNSLLAGRAGGIATAIGVALGQSLWACAASLGLIGLLLASAAAFHAVQLLGAVYLIFLGGQSLWAAVSGTPRSSEAVPVNRRRLSPPRALRQGIVSNLGNPKMAVFFASLLPQFAPAADITRLLALGLVFCAMTLAWLSAYAMAIACARDLLVGSWLKRVLDAAAGTALVALGLRLAAERR